jgi:hypothetical protein
MLGLVAARHRRLDAERISLAMLGQLLTAGIAGCTV